MKREERGVRELRKGRNEGTGDGKVVDRKLEREREEIRIGTVVGHISR